MNIKIVINKVWFTDCTDNLTGYVYVHTDGIFFLGAMLSLLVVLTFTSTATTTVGTCYKQKEILLPYQYHVLSVYEISNAKSCTCPSNVMYISSTSLITICKVHVQLRYVKMYL